MPIGNLTSQIFANIYLNELDRFVKHELKVKQYLRYGDDFILIEPDLQKLEGIRLRTIQLLGKTLKLRLNPKNDRILKVHHGLRFLGVVIYTKGRKLKERNLKRIARWLSFKNAGSYYGLIRKHGNEKNNKEFQWKIHELIFRKRAYQVSCGPRCHHAPTLRVLRRRSDLLPSKKRESDR